MNETPWWASQRGWGHVAIWITVIMFAILLVLTYDSHAMIEAGTERVPGYTVINKRIDYVYDEERRRYRPEVGGEQLLFGKRYSAEEAEDLVTHGKKIVQGRNCMNCHTFLGHGAYYAPDLTKSWLDPAWGSPQSREMLMVQFLQNPEENARTYGTGRVMPDLGITKEEARATVAYLKWMAAIDTNGFPHNFEPMTQGG